MNYIQDKRKRTVMYCKKKRMIIKKCIEMAEQCNTDIYICFFDQSQERMVEFSSNVKLGPETILKIKESDFK